MIWWLLILGIAYLLIAWRFFVVMSNHCVMACMTYKDYSIKNFVFALFFPILIIFLLIGSLLELIGMKKEINFEEFRKMKEEEYKHLVVTKEGNVKKSK